MLTLKPTTEDFASGAAEQTMSSREIADLCEKRHDHVMRDIRDMLVQLHGEGDLPKFGGIEKDARNRDQPIYRLPKRETLILVSGYRLDLRAKIIDRWEELERKVRSIDPMAALNDPAAMRSLLLTYTEKVLALEAKNTELGTKAEALDRIATADGSLSITEAAKGLQIRPKDLFDFLQRNGWIYRRTGGQSFLGYQSKTTAGLLEHKITTVLRADGSEKVTEQVRVTARGLSKLAQLIKPMELV